MKNLLLLGLCPLCITSCTASGKSDNGRVTEKKRVASDRQARESPQDNGFVTPDLSLLELKGHVKSVKYIKDNYEDLSYTFDKNGFLSSYPCHHYEEYDFIFKDGKAVGEDFSSERNAKGQLTQFSCGSAVEAMDGGGSGFDVHSISYDADGRPCSIEHSGMKYNYGMQNEYDERGLCILSTKKVSVFGIEPCFLDIKTTYTYTKFDEIGNWTERECKARIVEWEDEEHTSKKNVTDSREVEKRVITYYR